MKIDYLTSSAPKPLANYSEAIRVGPWVFAAGQLPANLIRSHEKIEIRSISAAPLKFIWIHTSYSVYHFQSDPYRREFFPIRYMHLHAAAILILIFEEGWDKIRRSEPHARHR